MPGQRGFKRGVALNIGYNIRRLWAGGSGLGAIARSPEPGARSWGHTMPDSFHLNALEVRAALVVEEAGAVDRPDDISL